MDPKYFRLVDRRPVPCELMEWAAYFETAERIVARTEIGRPVKQDGMPGSNVINLKPVFVSTVFLGLDHQYGDGPRSCSRPWCSAARTRDTRCAAAPGTKPKPSTRQRSR